MSYSYDTSLPAFKEAKLNLNDKQQKVYEVIEKYTNLSGMCNDREISDFLRWPINRLTPRRFELVNMGKIVEACKKKDPSTGRTVIYWKTNNGKLF